MHDHEFKKILFNGWNILCAASNSKIRKSMNIKPLFGLVKIDSDKS